MAELVEKVDMEANSVEDDLPQHILEKYDSDQQVQLIKGYRILQVIMYYPDNAPFFGKPENDKRGKISYYDVIKTPMWFNEIRRKFFDAEYNSITEVIKDMRLIYENCYIFWGPKTEMTESCLKIESLMEKQLLLLPKELRILSSLNETHGKNEDESILKIKNKYRSKGKHCSNLLLRTWEKKRIRENEEFLEKSDLSKFCNNSQKIIKWENEVLLLSDSMQSICTSSELPQIGQFLHLVQNLFKLNPFCQTEVERMFLIPKYSSSFRDVLKALLSYNCENSDVDPTYGELITELSTVVSEWYTVRKNNSNDDLEVLQVLGVQSNFFKTIGERNPLVRKKYENLPYHQRVLILKALCDHMLHSRSYIREAIADFSEMEISARTLGRDKAGYVYLYYDKFVDFRLYKIRIKNKDQCNKERLKDENNETKKSSVKFFPETFDDFYMIADSIEEMRNVIDELFYSDMENTKKGGKSANFDIIEALRSLETETSCKEDDFIKQTNNVRIKLFEEWIVQTPATKQKNSKKSDTEMEIPADVFTTDIVKTESAEIEETFDKVSADEKNIADPCVKEESADDDDSRKQKESRSENEISGSTTKNTRRRRSSVPSYNLDRDLYFSDNEESFSPEEMYSSESESDDDWEVPKKRSRKAKSKLSKQLKSMKNGGTRLRGRNMRKNLARNAAQITGKNDTLSNSLANARKLKVIGLATKVKSEPLDDPLRCAPSPTKPPVLIQPATVVGTVPVINAYGSLQPLVRIVGQPQIIRNAYLVNTTRKPTVPWNSRGQIRQLNAVRASSTYILPDKNRSALLSGRQSGNSSLVTTVARQVNTTTTYQTSYVPIRPSNCKPNNTTNAAMTKVNNALPKLGPNITMVPKLVSIKKNAINPNTVKEIEGTLGIHSNNGDLQYVVNLANGMRVPLSSDQVQKLRDGNNGALPHKLKIPVPSDVAEKIEPTVIIDD